MPASSTVWNFARGRFFPSISFRCRSGDLVLSVNGISLDGATQGDAVRLMTSTNQDQLDLTIVSWPGSSVWSRRRGPQDFRIRPLLSCLSNHISKWQHPSFVRWSIFVCFACDQPQSTVLRYEQYTPVKFYYFSTAQIRLWILWKINFFTNDMLVAMS